MNPAVNAICTLVPERALADADAADAALAAGRPAGPLHGLPIVIKDLVSTAGIRTTFGSPIYADHVPDQDDLIVERLRAAGAIVLGKSNVPEFGAGSHTFNPVFGATRNPYDLGRSCGGSSGGAAVALATGMVPIADGSDLGGSLRNPASFCNVVGFRPSPGRVPAWPTLDAWSPLAVLGPMGRSVGDAALLLSAIAGPDPRAPIAIAEPAIASPPPSTRASKARASPGAGTWGATRSSPPSRRPSTPSVRCSKRWAASSRTASPTSATPTPSSRRCAPGRPPAPASTTCGCIATA